MNTSTRSTEAFQISLAAAELYESAFVPAFFAQWAPILCDVAGVSPGQSVLDVACGTGIVTRTAADLVGADGSAVGLDLNESMLTVAQRIRPDVDWRRGDSAALPFANRIFDVVLCQMALMFFPDRQRAISEMGRVVKEGGTVGIVVPAALDDQPAFKPFLELAARLTGPDAMSLLGTYFVCGRLDEMRDLLASSRLDVTTARAVTGTYTAPSVEAAVTTEVESTPLVERISAATYRRLREEAVDVFAPWTAADGTLVAPFTCHVLAARG